MKTMWIYYQAYWIWYGFGSARLIFHSYTRAHTYTQQWFPIKKLCENVLNFQFRCPLYCMCAARAAEWCTYSVYIESSGIKFLLLVLRPVNAISGDWILFSFLNVYQLFWWSTDKHLNLQICWSSASYYTVYIVCVRFYALNIGKQ